ncbi:MAG: tyrosine-type recombinase/integrase [Clostridia bacterium]|jgi:integrase/recombinase XerC/integrase/recombinase XerD|nr:tyrosine-type recombinase/integrase [Clostridia bacterium]MBQ5900407.1 tyrosine-type recombinase/integrase [Clostridia bacterium]
MEISVLQPQQGILTAQGANISAVVSAFAISQDVKTTTRELYRRTLSTFFDWVRETGRTITALSVVDLIQYKDELLNAGKSTLTVASYINSIRRFYEWAEANKYYPNIGKGVHAPKRRQQFRKQPLTVAQVGDLLRHEKEQTPRDYALINLIVRTGLRCIEVVRADVGDITYISGQRVLMIHGKGRDEKDNFVILPDGVYLPIKAYLDTREDITPNAPLFASVSNRNSGGRMTTRAVSGIAKAGLKNVGLDNKVFTAHSLRHTAAVNVLRAGGSREKVQEMLRHANPATTEIYIATIKEEQRIKSGAEYLLDDLYSTLAL